MELIRHCLIVGLFVGYLPLLLLLRSLDMRHNSVREIVFFWTIFLIPILLIFVLGVLLRLLLIERQKEPETIGKFLYPVADWFWLVHGFIVAFLMLYLLSYIFPGASPSWLPLAVNVFLISLFVLAASLANKMGFVRLRNFGLGLVFGTSLLFSGWAYWALRTPAIVVKQASVLASEDRYCLLARGWKPVTRLLDLNSFVMLADLVSSRSRHLTMYIDRAKKNEYHWSHKAQELMPSPPPYLSVPKNCKMERHFANQLNW